MKKHIHCFISESNQLDGARNVDINEMKNVANGSCDYVSFVELNSIPLDNIDAVVTALSKKIKLGTGRLLIEFLIFDKTISDIMFSKLDINKLNSLLSDKGSLSFTLISVLDSS